MMSPARGRTGGSGGVPSGVKAGSLLRSSAGWSGEFSFISGTSSRRARPKFLSLSLASVALKMRTKSGLNHMFLIFFYSVSNPWIEITVSDINKQVHQQENDGDKSDDTDNQRLVTVERGIDEVVPQPGQDKNALDNHRAG